MTPETAVSRATFLGIMAGFFGAACEQPMHPVTPVAERPVVSTGAPSAPPVPASEPPKKRVIVFVWDGLRPDSINAEDTPHLAEMAKAGTTFVDHHATFPSFTMVNAASLATGGSAQASGFSSNWVWQPGAVKLSPTLAPLLDASGVPQHYEQPFFTEDHAAIRDLDQLYDGELLMVGSLFEAARARGFTTVALGKSGPVYLQDRRRSGIVFDEKAAWPKELVKELSSEGVRLPKGTVAAYPEGEVSLESTNGDPTAIPPSSKLPDGKTPDPLSEAGAPASASNAYLLEVYLEHLLPEKAPELTVLWNRNPDTAQHWYGPGTRNVKLALREADAQLGKLLGKLRQLGWLETTSVMVVSDHAHSSVSGPLSTFPLRALTHSKVGDVDPGGFSVSGDVRLADLLTRLGKFHAYDGVGCLYNPVLSGIGANGKPLYPERVDDAAGTKCGRDPKTGEGRAKYTTPSYKVPAKVPGDALVVALNGGTDFIYAPGHDATLIARVVRFLQARPEVGSIFLNARYSPLPGTLPLSSARAEASDPRRNPDIFVSYAYDENTVVQGMRGIIYEGAQNYRGMHGSFSPVDIHNTLVAMGPDFRKSWTDPLPTGNVDVAPTVAKILGLALPQAEGRPLDEALVASGVSTDAYAVKQAEELTSTTVTGLEVLLPTDTDGTRVDKSKTRYRSVVHFRDLVRDRATYRYFDWGKAFRE